MMSSAITETAIRRAYDALDVVEDAAATFLTDRPALDGLRNVTAVNRQLAVIVPGLIEQARAEGATWRQIGDALELSATTVSTWYREAKAS